APDRQVPRLERGVIGDAVQPGAQTRTRPDRGGLANEYEKRRLVAVLRIRPARQQPPANIPDHRAMPTHQLRECDFAALGDKRIEQRGVGSLLELSRLAHAIHHLLNGCAQHALSPRVFALNYYFPRRRRFYAREFGILTTYPGNSHNRRRSPKVAAPGARRE